MLHFDKTYSDTWERRTLLLNGTTYGDYLASDAWSLVRKKANRRKKYKNCLCCGNPRTELHHKDYKWIFTKDELRSVIPICRTHHQEIHDLAKEQKISVRLATNQTLAKYKIKRLERF
jgi:hypothetical protein